MLKSKVPITFRLSYPENQLKNNAKLFLNYERILNDVTKNDIKNCFFSINVKGDIVLVKTFLSRLVKLFLLPPKWSPEALILKTTKSQKVFKI